MTVKYWIQKNKPVSIHTPPPTGHQIGENKLTIIY